MKANQLAMIFVGWALIADLIRRDFPSVAGTVVVAVVGYVMASPGGLRQAYETFRARRLRQRYKVLDGGVPSRGPKTKTNRSQKFWN